MKFSRLVLAALVGCALMAQAQSAGPQATVSKTPSELSPAAAATIEKNVESFLRNLYAWGPAFQLKVGPPTSSAVSSFYELSVEVTAQGQSDSAMVYVTKDGKYMFRGEIEDLNKDPLLATRQQLHLDGYASKGPADAKVVLVEFGDFECPSCRQLDQVLRAVLPKYPQVRLVFKDFPLEQIHPWAMTAAVAGHCVLHQNSEAFWKFHDSVYDAQDLISPENALAKLSELATQAGANPEQFQACMSDPKTSDPIRESMDEGRALAISATPTSFIDGRRLVGADPNLLQQFIDFDLHTP